MHVLSHVLLVLEVLSSVGVVLFVACLLVLLLLAFVQKWYWLYSTFATASEDSSFPQSQGVPINDVCIQVSRLKYAIAQAGGIPTAKQRVQARELAEQVRTIEKKKDLLSKQHKTMLTHQVLPDLKQIETYCAA